MSIKNLQLLNNAIESTDFSSLSDLPGPDAKLEEFTAIMDGLADLYCPLKKVKLHYFNVLIFNFLSIINKLKLN